MKPLSLLALSCTILLLASCKKDAAVPDPQAAFTFRDQDVNEFKIATYDTITLVNNSTNGDSVSWDLGNGVTSKQQQVVASYARSGTYSITMVVSNAAGKKSTITKSIRVLDRILKRITIKTVYWDPTPKNIDHFNYIWPETSTATIYLQMRHYSYGDSVVPYGGLMPNSPVLYTSPEIPNVPNTSFMGITLGVDEKFVVDKQMALDRSLAAFLMAKDASGSTFNLMSNNSSGSSWGLAEDFANNKWLIVFDLFSSVRLEGDYE